MSDDRHQQVEKVASAIEDLIQMEVIRLQDKKSDKAVLSSRFAQIVANVVSDMKIGPDTGTDEIMKMMYYSLLIYMTEHLKLPRSLVMALGNDMERNRENMESGELMTTYVSILSQLWTREMQGANKN